MKTIFFDLDDTLYFRRDAFFLAFTDYFGHKYDTVKILANDRCRIRGDEVFFQSQQGIISEKQMYIYRFQTGFRDAGISISESDALEFYSLYKKELYSMKLNPATISMLDFAKKYFSQLGVITNGQSSHQRSKIENLGLNKWIDPKLIIISGEQGCPKPDKKIFKIAEEKSCTAPENLIIIGDSYSNDILPARDLGWHTIWIDLYGENFEAPEFRAENTMEVIDCLKKIQI
ncbi:MAG: HAD family hydrolase [Treponema sp.]|nr:HAD family hydrolase [Treponema sp.]